MLSELQRLMKLKLSLKNEFVSVEHLILAILIQNKQPKY
jgi:hypothetical protein